MLAKAAKREEGHKRTNVIRNGETPKRQNGERKTTKTEGTIHTIWHNNNDNKCIYIYIHTYIHTYIYRYRYRERDILRAAHRGAERHAEGEAERAPAEAEGLYVCVYIYIYIHTFTVNYVKLPLK